MIEQIRPLNDTRQIQLDDYRSASSAVLRYQVTRLLFLFLFVAPRYGKMTFSRWGRRTQGRARASARANRLQPWLFGHSLRRVCPALLNGRVARCRRQGSASLRRPLRNDTMATVYIGVVRALGSIPYGCGEVDALVSVFGKAPRARTWKDAKSEPFGRRQGHPRSTGGADFEAHPDLQMHRHAIPSANA